MKHLNTRSNSLAIIMAIALLPFTSLSQDSYGPQAQISTSKTEVSEPQSNASESKGQVSEIKKMTRYSIGFVIDLPSVNDVLAYMNENLGVDVQDTEQMNDPNWNPTTYSTRNYEVAKTESGEFEVKVRFYPPANPMSIENVDGIQRKSRRLRTAAIEKLKADQID